MSILIRGMEMPKNCKGCFFLGTDDDAHWYCYCLKKKIRITSEKAYDSDCPLIELPPHGRLIDADKLPMNMDCPRVEYEDLVNAPTIIPADESDMDSFIHIYEEDGMDSFIQILKD